MFQFEKRLWGWIEERLVIIVGVVFTGVSLAARLLVFGHESSDMTLYLLPWFEQLKELGGIKALSTSIGDYNLFYLTIMSVLTYIDLPPIFLIKTVSIIFDYVIAVAVALIVSDQVENKKQIKAVLAYCFVLFLPTVYINAALWGQCDAMYASFLFLCFLFLGRRKESAALLMYGLALSCKLQAIFFLPFLLFYYFKEKRFPFLSFLYLPLVMIVTALPSIAVGRPILDVFYIYFLQTKTYTTPTISYPNIYTLLNTPTGFAFEEYVLGFGILATLAALLIGFLYFAKCGPKTISFEMYVTIAAWSGYCCVLLLPRMHERYGFATELLFVLLALLNQRYTLYACGIVFIGTIAYFPYLTGQFMNQTPLCFVNILLFILFSFVELRSAFCDEDKVQNLSEIHRKL